MVDAARHSPVQQPLAGRVHLLLLLRHGGACADGVLLPFHTTGVLWAPASAPVTAFPCTGGDLHPFLQDVCLCALVN
jgi:hypothetical protein